MFYSETIVFKQTYKLQFPTPIGKFLFINVIFSVKKNVNISFINFLIIVRYYLL